MRCPGKVGFDPLETDPRDPIVLAVEEYEAIRLIDYLGCTQEETAAPDGGCPHDGAGDL